MQVEAHYRVTTPLFCGGAEPERQAELRLPSFKGALRFWWRAIAWSTLGGDLKKISEEEAKLFGSNRTGRSCVSMQLTGTPNRLVISKKGEKIDRKGRPIGSGCGYLGYGVMTAFGAMAGQLTRACIAAPFDFTVRLRARKLESFQLDSLNQALVALGTLGGLGAKSRKGYGSLTLRSSLVNGEKAWDAPKTIPELKSAIERLPRGDGESEPEWPEYTALSSKARHVLLECNSTEPLELMDRIGREMIRYRSWGRNGVILNNQPSEKNFKADHDLMKQPRKERQHHPERVAFGLPHNYGRDPGQQVGPSNKGLDRRASPLFIHIHQCGGQPVAVLSFLPARFLPGKPPRISVGGKPIPQKREDELYRPVHGFLDRLADIEKRKEHFTASETVP